MKNKMLKTGLTLGALVAMGCAAKKDDKSTTLYATSFAMSASSAPRTVAKLSPVEKFVEMLMPKAIAGIPTNLVDSQNTSVTLSAAWIVVKEIEFKSAETVGEESEDESTEEVKFRGPYFVNLTSATAQVLDTQSIPAKIIRRIEMKLEASENSSQADWPADAPAGLENKSMYVSGTFGSSNTAFSYSSNDGAEFKVSGAGGISPEEGQNILLAIQFGDLIRQINFSALATANNKNIDDSNRVPATNPCPNIDTSAADLFTCFRKGLESQADIGKDSDGSGEIEADEDSAKE